MTTANTDNPDLDDFTENISRAKRDLVMRFVKDQEALQTSQVDLKIVDDETIDLIDSALVVKGEDTKITDPDTENLKQEQPLSTEISALSLDAEKANKSPEAVIVPRPPSGRPRTRSSSSRKRSVPAILRRQRSVDAVNSTEKYPSKDEGNECNFRDLLAQERRERTELNSTPYTEEQGAEANLNSSWPQEFLSKKLYVPLQNHSAYTSREAAYYCNTPVENFSGIDNRSESLRPRTSQSFQRVRPAEIISARISSASECERITCSASSLTNPSPYARKMSKGSRRRTYINFNRLDAHQIALEGPLELEPVHPSDIPLYRSSSAASSSAPYALVHVPPIGREGPAPSSS